MIWDKYLGFVRSLPCAICEDDTRTEAHHEKGNKRGGVGLKSHHIRAMPLCKDHHAEFHRIGHESFEKQYGITQPEMICDTIERAVYQGVIVFDKEMV